MKIKYAPGTVYDIHYKLIDLIRNGPRNKKDLFNALGDIIDLYNSIDKEFGDPFIEKVKRIYWNALPPSEKIERISRSVNEQIKKDPYIREIHRKILHIFYMKGLSDLERHEKLDKMLMNAFYDDRVNDDGFISDYYMVFSKHIPYEEQLERLSEGTMRIFDLSGWK